MLFASYEFLMFLAAVLILYYVIPRKAQWGFLLAASYVFYFFASPYYLIFLAVTSLSVYLTARAVEAKRRRDAAAYAEAKEGLDRDQRKAYKERQRRGVRRVFLAGLLLNLGILAVLKYARFTVSNLNAILAAFGTGSLPLPSLILPMGISFYTFQAAGYLLDVYWEKIPAEKNPFRFALFVSFFPQLVQGPISRHSDLARTLYEEHRPSYAVISSGLSRVLWGYFKKLVIADRALIAVSAIIGEPETYRGELAFAGMLLYALELYADFTGGIDITIGIAEALGIRVVENFRRPYFSKGIKEYWNRWHITMGAWFTDYVFYPVSVSGWLRKLGKASRKRFGNAVGKRIPVYLSSAIVWFATGLWHGASWNFIAWGMGNFVVIMISQELEPLYARFHKRFAVAGKSWYKCFQVVRTVLLMSCLRMFDCYRDVPLTFRMFGSMLTDFRIFRLTGEVFLGLGLSGLDYAILAAGVLLLTAVSLAQRSGSVRERLRAARLPARICVWYGLFVITLLFGVYGIGYDANQFIYNQF